MGFYGTLKMIFYKVSIGLGFYFCFFVVEMSFSNQSGTIPQLCVLVSYFLCAAVLFDCQKGLDVNDRRVAMRLMFFLRPLREKLEENRSLEMVVLNISAYLRLLM